MRSITSWCTACIPGRKRKEIKIEEPEKSSLKKSSDDQAEGSHQGTTLAASNDTGGAAVTTAAHMSASNDTGGSGVATAGCDARSGNLWWNLLTMRSEEEANHGLSLEFKS
ncbi:hypothetical protein POTOM_001899 [Populus tomentosa]|uniref:Uncharacterized protein n=1 Tax=Populus tomentosa TaxID=118781 RepID=A0A8X8DIX4_POPTO|nr:hypothetical protein POTOM_001899 [Populus tomentosa]